MQGPRLLRMTIGKVLQDIEMNKILFVCFKLQESKAKLECVIYNENASAERRKQLQWKGDLWNIWNLNT